MEHNTFELMEHMDDVRKYCALGHAIRKEYGIPVSYPLHEVQFNGCKSDVHQNYNFLWSDEYELIADELNCRNVNPFINHSSTENWVTKSDGNYTISIRIDKDELLDYFFELRTKHRSEMEERKSKGIWVK